MVKRSVETRVSRPVRFPPKVEMSSAVAIPDKMGQNLISQVMKLKVAEADRFARFHQETDDNYENMCMYISSCFKKH